MKGQSEGQLDTQSQGGTNDASAFDHQMFQRWRAGDAQAGDALVRRHYTSVLRFFEYRVGQASEDLVQRTFAACAEALPRYRAEGSFRAFLFGIARNMLLNFHRSRRDMDDLSRLDAQDSAMNKTGMSTIVARRDEHRILLQALVAMPEQLQTALVLFYWDGLRAREVGEVMGCPTSTATTRLARAREVLREHVCEFAAAGSTRERIVDDVEAWLRALPRPPSPPRGAQD